MIFEIRARDVFSEAIKTLLEQRNYFISICRWAFVFFIIVNSVDFFLSIFPGEETGALAFVVLLASLGAWVVQTVIAVATHRFILLGEVKTETNLYKDIGRREIVFAGVGFALWLIAGVASAIIFAVVSIPFVITGVSSVFVIGLYILPFLFALYWVAPVVLVFPSIAVEKFSEFFDVVKSLAPMRGVIFRTFLLTTVVYSVPVVIVWYFSPFWTVLVIADNVVLWMITMAIRAIYDLIGVFLFVLIASILYKRIFAASSMDPAYQSQGKPQT